MPRLRRLSAAFTLALLLASSAALAKPRYEPPRDRLAVAAAAEALVSRLLGWLGDAWTKAGCGIDPDGQCPASSGTTVPPPRISVDPASSEGK